MQVILRLSNIIKLFLIPDEYCSGVFSVTVIAGLGLLEGLSGSLAFRLLSEALSRAFQFVLSTKTKQKWDLPKTWLGKVVETGNRRSVRTLKPVQPRCFLSWRSMERAKDCVQHATLRAVVMNHLTQVAWFDGTAEFLQGYSLT